MGTNYFLRIDCCDKCGRSDEERHIGKASAGWTFSFQGYHDYDYPIKSFADWKAEIDREDTAIYDEYGRNVDKNEFYNLVEKKKSERLNHTVESSKHQWGDDVWVDEEGHSFSGGEFS